MMCWIQIPLQVGAHSFELLLISEIDKTLKAKLMQMCKIYSLTLKAYLKTTHQVSS